MSSVKFKRGLQVDVPNDDPDSLIVTQPTDNTEYDSIFLGNNQIGTTHVYAGDSETIQGLDYYRPGLVPSGDGSGNKYLSGAGTWVSTSSISNAESITYASLKTLRDSGNLVPGKWYRITDYVTTTAQTNTQSAGHQFDIIVRADDESHLNENAYAAIHTGNTYFQNSNLDAWQLKYCLDNSTTRFAWADDTNGKGVVYYMKDEWNNECPYDFKNIQFKRWAIEEYTANPALVVDGEGNDYGYYYGAMQFDGETQTIQTATYGEDYGWFYTFALKDITNNEWYDYSVVSNLSLKNDEGYAVACYDNHISQGTDEYNSGNGELAKMLNNIVFFNCYTDLTDTSYADDYSYCNNNRFEGNCYSNTFGNDCIYNTFGNNCGNNTLGIFCQSNTFGNDCIYNTFGNDCIYNTFGNDCNSNTFGNDCYSNTFGNDCYSNTFGNDCYSNTFGNYCYSNTFGNDCYSNTFGNDCIYNTFGNYCNNNTFGNDCYSNTFGNDCIYNTFGNYCNNNTFGNYIRQLTVYEGVQYCSVTGGSSSSSYVQNAQILNGVQGTSANNKLTITFEKNKTYTQVACMTPSGGLKIFKAGYPIEILDLTD